jgi:hypothetical protein
MKKLLSVMAIYIASSIACFVIGYLFWPNPFDFWRVAGVMASIGVATAATLLIRHFSNDEN